MCEKPTQIDPRCVSHIKNELCSLTREAVPRRYNESVYRYAKSLVGQVTSIGVRLPIVSYTVKWV